MKTEQMLRDQIKLLREMLFEAELDLKSLTVARDAQLATTREYTVDELIAATESAPEHQKRKEQLLALGISVSDHHVYG